MDGDDEEPTGYEMLVPYVSCISNGGPYEDISFTAGFEMGKLWAICTMLANAGLASFEMTIRTENRQLADLIAMNFGAHVIDMPDLVLPDDGTERSLAPGPMAEWRQITVSWIPLPEPAEEP